MRGKTITANQLLGERGIALVSELVLEMGYVWRPTATLDAGIDGEIELRNPQTGQVANQIIKVQSKAVTTFAAGTENGFDFWPTEKDVQYWLGGNVPVILIVSRPETSEAYWVSVKDYKESAGSAKKIHFDKARDRFDSSAAPALASLARSSMYGAYSPPVQRQESLISNLLPVIRLPELLYIASTDYRDRKPVFDVLNQHSAKHSAEWILKDKRIISFQDLREPPYTAICDRGTVEEFHVTEWSASADPERQRDFVQLLNCALREKVRPFNMAFEHRHPFHCYYFRGNQDLKPLSFGYFGGKKETDREVFRAYYTRHGKVRYCRHSAFKGQFYRFEDSWYLEVTPTYYFTRDGLQLYRFYEEPLKGIKVLERNNAVRGQLIMWAELLTMPPDMYRPEYPFLGFGPPAQFALSVGLDDNDWLEREKKDTALSKDMNLPLFEIAR
jgi:hypothetical protein